ncbi:MAG TPA: hypothetical protein VK901_09020 [Nitrospiraceae bacterium]|nr:hypothetical protein [Nitrospiraceae bacterium]
MGITTPQRKQPTKAEHSVSAYADESIAPNIIVCAAAVFPVEQVSSAETSLASMKDALRLSPATPLHCRIVFNGSERKRHPEWKNVSPKAINSVIKALCVGLSGISHRPIVVVAKPTSVVIPRVPGDEPKDAILDAKGQVAIGFQTLGYHLTRVYGYGATKLWLDPDRTKIPWLKGKTQANLTRSPFMDLGPDIEPPKFEPIIETGPKPRLLEIADLYAYITAQAHMGGVVGSIGGFKNSIP